MLYPGSLYIVLHSQFPKASYHWGLYFHLAGDSRSPFGRKFHIVNTDSLRWAADFQDTCGVFKSKHLLGLIRIASIPPHSFDYMKNLIEGTPCNTPGITCRVWVLNAVRSLMVAGLVKCTDIRWLENEVFGFGFLEEPSCLLGVRLRPIIQSRFCIC